VARRGETVTDGRSRQVGIIELVDVCARMRARNLELFEQLGGWIVDTTDANLQRSFTEGAHRHAWHADLWAQRMPVVAGVVAGVAADDSIVTRPATVLPANRARAYRAALDELMSEVDALRTRVDDLLDPSTARTIELVQRDVAQLRDRLHD
jgi:hypothetical protein